MEKSKKIFSITLFKETLEKEKAEGIITQQDIDFALISWANSLDGKTIDEIKQTNENNDSFYLKDEWFLELT